MEIWTSNLFYEQLWSKMVVYGFIDNRYLILDKVLKEYFWLTSKEGFHYQILWTNLLPFLYFVRGHTQISPYVNRLYYMYINHIEENSSI